MIWPAGVILPVRTPSPSLGLPSPAGGCGELKDSPPEESLPGEGSKLPGAGRLGGLSRRRLPPLGAGCAEAQGEERDPWEQGGYPRSLSPGCRRKGHGLRSNSWGLQRTPPSNPPGLWAPRQGWGPRPWMSAGPFSTLTHPIALRFLQCPRLPVLLCFGAHFNSKDSEEKLRTHIHTHTLSSPRGLREATGDRVGQHLIVSMWKVTGAGWQGSPYAPQHTARHCLLHSPRFASHGHLGEICRIVSHPSKYPKITRMKEWVFRMLVKPSPSREPHHRKVSSFPAQVPKGQL